MTVSTETPPGRVQPAVRAGWKKRPVSRYLAALRKLPWLAEAKLAHYPAVVTVAREIRAFDGPLSHRLTWVVEHSRSLDVIEAALFGLLGTGHLDRVAQWLHHTDPKVRELTADLLPKHRTVPAAAARHIEKRLGLEQMVPSATIIRTAQCLEQLTPLVMANLIRWSEDPDPEIAKAALCGLARAPRMTLSLQRALALGLSRRSDVRRAVVLTIAQLGARAACMLPILRMYTADAITANRSAIDEAIRILEGRPVPKDTAKKAA